KRGCAQARTSPVRRTKPLRRCSPVQLRLEPLEHRCLPSGYTAADLGTLGGSFSEEFAINSSAQVVGGSYTAGGNLHAYLYSGGRMTDLGTLGGGQSNAFAINNRGDVAGWSDTGGGATH